METIVILILSIIVSAFGSIVGFGGGVFMIPILVIVFGFSIKLAIGSVILALIPAAAVSSIFNMRNSSIDYYAALILEIPTVIGTMIGAYLTKLLPIEIVEIMFSVIIFLIGIHSIKTSKTILTRQNRSSLLYKLNKFGWAVIRRNPFGAYRISLSLGAFFGTISGMVAGFLGIGGGFLKVPIMINIFKMPSFVASSTALFMIFFTSLTGGISHYLLGHIHFDKTLPIIIGFFVGAFLGNLYNVKLSEKELKMLVGIGLLLASLSILGYVLLT